MELAQEDSRVVLLTGDLGYTVIEPFAERFPDRFFNVGVAEQNMVGVATGLAEAGYIPFVYSIATFAALRPYEFIRNGPIFHRLPVRIIGVGGGLEYGPAGTTHHAIEDVGVMRIQPGISVIAPADAAQAETALRATWNSSCPTYYRLGKDEVNLVPGLLGRFESGHIEIVREGPDLVLLAMGPVAIDAVHAATTLARDGLECTVVVVASVNPPPVTDLVSLLARFPLALTLEAHYVVGGLGSLVAEVIAEQGLHCRLIRSGVRETPGGITGSERFLLEHHGITAEGLVDSARLAIHGLH